MQEKPDVGFGVFDSLVARRLMRHGPVELNRMFSDDWSVVRAIVKYKWITAPDVKLARKIHRLLKWIKIVDPVHYKLSRKQILEDIKLGANGDVAGYKEFVRLIDNPEFNKKHDSFINELIENSPKTKVVVLKLSERDDVLQKFHLDYRSDYIVNDSKKVDFLLLKLAFLRVFCTHGIEFFLKFLYVYLILQNDKAKLGFANLLWSDCPDLIASYQYNLELQQEAYEKAKDVWRETIDECLDVYYNSEKMVDKKYENIKRYKSLIESGQLPVFKKK